MPRGVVGIISPWNFPFAIAIGEMVMALIAGNAVVLKPSEVTPLIALKTKELYDASGLPPDLFQVVTGRGAAGAALIDSGIDYCIFTGSTATGKKVAAACGERLIPCALELGGKAPAIVCADADLDRTAQGARVGRVRQPGPGLRLGRARLRARGGARRAGARRSSLTQKLRQGDPRRRRVDVGSMTWDRQVEIVEERVAVGGRRRAPRCAPAASARGQGPALRSRRCSPTAARTWTSCARRSSARSCRS